jgi:prephenate dehydrogenase
VSICGTDPSRILNPQSSIFNPRLPVAVSLMLFKHIAIVGVGLIGGSFALAVRRAGVCERITGWDRKEVLDRALAGGVIDGVESAFESGEVSEADLVYLAAPVGAILSFLRTRSNSLKPGAIVTDAGSTKREICRVARESLPRAVSFVGGHPMAGSERTGVEFADANLFNEAAYALVARDGGPANAMRLITETVRIIGARPITLSAERHDRIAARISHSPQLISTALALAVSRMDDSDALSLGGSGFAEMTRLAESGWSVWEDICRTNSDEITSALDEAIAQIEAVRMAISSGDFSGAGDMFRAAGEVTRRLRESKRGGV